MRERRALGLDMISMLEKSDFSLTRTSFKENAAMTVFKRTTAAIVVAAFASMASVPVLAQQAPTGPTTVPVEGEAGAGAGAGGAAAGAVGVGTAAVAIGAIIAGVAIAGSGGGNDDNDTAATPSHHGTTSHH